MKNLSSTYPVWLCDIWGVVHDGLRPYPMAVDALSRHRDNGGTVVLISNSPRTAAGVTAQLDEMGVARAAYDSIVTSGDVTRVLVEAEGGGRVFHLGPSRDLSIFEGLDVERVPLDQAHAVLCTGLFDDSTETPDDYVSLLRDMKARGLTMICANPDVMVRVGHQLLYCAGALAGAYAAINGPVSMAGKPHKPIYDVALEKAQHSGRAGYDRSQVLAIGDGPETDIRGAAAQGFDAVLIAAGVTDASLGLDAVEAHVRRAVPDARLIAVMHELAWVR